MRTSPLSRTIRASLCIGALIVTMSAAGGTPAVPNEAKLQALQQQLDELNNQLGQLKSARAAAAQQPIPSRWSMQSMRGMGARGCGARMRAHMEALAGAGASVLIPSAPDLDALTQYLSNHGTDRSLQ